jgi:dTMP kinase
VFVTFEGVDASGKSTQAELAGAFLAGGGREVVVTREPGGTELGEMIRELLLEGPEMSAWAEANLFAAARAEHAEQVIRPALERGAHVVCDRFVDSSIVYQGLARGLGVTAVRAINAAVADLVPDRTFCLLVDEATTVARLGTRRDRIEREREGFREAVLVGYRKLAAEQADRIRVIDGSLPADEVARLVRKDLGARV